MSSQTTYRCDFCRGSDEKILICLFHSENRDGSSLKLTSNLHKSDFHLCTRCIDAIKSESVKIIGMSKPNPEKDSD